MEVIIPLAGEGARLIEHYPEAKPFIKIGNKTLLEISLLGLPADARLIFVCKQEHATFLSNLLETSKVIAERSYKISIVPGPTSGQAESVKYGLKLVKANAPIVVSNCDTFFSSDFVDFGRFDGAIGTFESDNSSYSYVTVKDGAVTRAAEKEIISNRATTGLYYFSSKDLYLDAYKMTDWSNLKEKYVAPMYNCLIGYGLKVKEIPMKTVIPLGTKTEIEYALKNQNFLELINGK